MIYLEIAVSFIIGFLLILLLGWVFSLKTKGLMRLALNAVCGTLILVLLSLFGVAYFPVNPLSALLTGLLGLPGLVLIFLITVYL